MASTVIERRVREQYAVEYPDWTGVRVADTVDNVFGGTLVTVKSKLPSGEDNEELCFVDQNNKIRIFATTAELARFFESKASSQPLLERIFSQAVVSGVIFLLLLVALVTIGFIKPDYPPNILNVLTSVVGAAAGFFFGSSRLHVGSHSLGHPRNHG